ncbi:MAG: M1 family metallopeptidase [Alphaproteobacteria bacterium]|nr:MAG: M1 family metallopeptidase [Alphaproteobacteria bacterium]
MRSFLAAALALLACACSPSVKEQKAEEQRQASAAPKVAPILNAPDAKDIHSYARPAEARVTHVALDLRTDFEAKRIGGTATLDVQAAPGAKEIVLDTKGLEIEEVTDAEGRTLAFRLGASDPILGAPLIIALGNSRQIHIRYRSGPDAGALQWLTPEQTAGKKKPFLFSQGESILNRSWIPTQDSPGIRQTWEARIVVPEGLKAVMSGDKLTPDGEAVSPTEGGGRAFRFRMDKPVAPYLIAIAVGDIGFQPLGKRTGIYAEPATLKAAAWEFADTEKMVDAAEALYGPYRWGRYDILVLPPAFPFGGMENPTLTFATPTAIAGDRSLVSLIAHELAHSWSGNLVTNATWADFWLNEGFTTYFQSRIMEKLYGTEATNREIALGWDDLQAAIKEAGGPGAPGTKLHLDLKGGDPDSAMADIAYEKGAAFLRTVERTVGRERFDAYLRSYFDRHAFQPMTASVFLADIRANLVKGDKALEQSLRLDEWVYQPGIPTNVAPPPAEAFAAVDRASASYAGGAAPETVPFAKWSTSERLRFLNRLPRQLSRERLDTLDRAFRLSQSGNSEVLFAWLKLAIPNHYDPAVPAVEHFLTTQGRRKFVLPLFKALLAEGDWGRPLAQRIYAKARPTYHPVTSSSVDEAMGG